MGAAMPKPVTEKAIQVPIGRDVLEGDLRCPAGAQGVVAFAHGSGSSRHSRRNQSVARILESRAMATLLVDLLTPQEAAIDRVTAHLRFDIAMLAVRVQEIVDWLKTSDDTRGLPIGLFGASTGAAAALVAAASRQGDVGAVVSRGGRPDLAGVALQRVTSPTLLIVGSLDAEVLRLNRAAMRQMTSPVTLKIVPGATHLFEEPGALVSVANLAADFFAEHLRVA